MSDETASFDNADSATVAGFGAEWKRFDHAAPDHRELREVFDAYFSEFPWSALPRDAVGADIGCGTGRWARYVAPRVRRLYCVDASREALDVARKNLASEPACELVHATVADLPIEDGSLDFAYSLGVLHHVPDTAAALRACARKLKPGAPLLVYIYYAFDNRGAAFRALWRASDLARRALSRLEPSTRARAADALAATVYFPLARASRSAEAIGLDVSSWPLSFYRDKSFYMMRNDALDRFGTRLEQRFTRRQIADMMRGAGLERIRFREGPPSRCAVGFAR